MQQEIGFDKLKVQLVADYFERADTETLLSRHHPLGARKAIGNRLCYSISYRGVNAGQNPPKNAGEARSTDMQFGWCGGVGTELRVEGCLIPVSVAALIDPCDSAPAPRRLSGSERDFKQRFRP